MSRHTLIVGAPCFALLAAICWAAVCVLNRPEAAPQVAQDHADKIERATGRLKAQLRHPDSLRVTKVVVTSVDGAKGGHVGNVELTFTARGADGETCPSIYRMFFGLTDQIDGLPEGKDGKVLDPDGVFLPQ